MEKLRDYLTLEGWRRDLDETLEDTKDILWNGLKVALPAWIMFSLFSHNGCMDSYRTKNARQWQSLKNPAKVVAEVKEKWKDNSPLAAVSSALGGSGYNPRVIRDITFRDGSRTRLDYRTLAHQPFVKWIKGEEFDPKPGEKYEVTPKNTPVRKIN